MTSNTLVQRATGANIRVRLPAAVRHQHLLAALVLIVVLAIFYSDVVFGGRSFLMGPITRGVTPDGPYGYDETEEVDRFVGDPGAIAWAMEPWSFTINRMFKQGELPLWNPHQGLGTPLLGSAQPAPFDPLLLIVHLAPEAWWPVAVDVHLLLRYFLAGFFTYLLLCSVGTGFVAAVAGGVTFMLSSYLVFYGNIAFVRADALMPLLIYTYDRLAVQPTRRTFLFSIVALWLIVVTGFPETLPLHVGLAGLWYVFRTLALLRSGDGGLKAAVWRVARLAGSGIFAALLSAFVLGPFIETVMHAEHIHYAGSTDREMSYAGEFVPTLVSVFLPVERSMFNIPNIFPLGILALALTFTAALRSLAHVLRPRLLEAATLFFFVIGVALVLIAFRGPLLHFVPDLPGISSIIMWKYPQVLIAFCVAFCVGTGVQFLLDDRARLGYVAGGVLLLVTCLLLLLSNRMDADSAVNTLAPIGQVVLLLALLAGLTFLLNRFPIRGRVLVWGVVALLLVEPMLWFSEIDRSVRTFPYEPPPYIDLMNRSGETYRVLGIDNQLFPNTASAFGIDDIRYVDALHPHEYLDFARQYVITPEVRRRFTGSESTIQFNRGINFLNVEYVVTGGTDGRFLRYLAGVEWSENYNTSSVTIGGQTESVLNTGEANPIRATVRVPPGQRSVFDITLGVDPMVWACACMLEQGVTFKMFAQTEAGLTPLLEQFVDPVNNPEDRRWFRQRIDLSEWAAETVTLILVKEAPNDAELEYALWADPIRLSVGYTFPWLDDAAADNPTLSITRWLALPLYSITLDGDTRLAVRQHPVSRASVPLVLPDGDATLSFGLGLDPELWAGRIDESTLGDGVTFSVNLQSRGESVTVFEQYVDPKNNLDERRWQDFTVDLSRWSGQPAELIFSTDAGPVGDATYDWAFWSDITVSGSDINPVMAFVSDTRQFAQVYEDEDVSVFRNELVFPRAYVVRNVVVADDTADAVERFGDPDFNPANAVILTGPLDAETQARLDALPSNLLADTVDVTGERVNSMTLAADLSAPGVLVVSELDYPGWHAHVDGVETPILQANGVARALYLDAGQHTIEFYYHPLPFWGGVWVSVAALVLLAVVWWLWGRRGTVEQPALVEAPEPATA